MKPSREPFDWEVGDDKVVPVEQLSGSGSAPVEEGAIPPVHLLEPVKPRVSGPPPPIYLPFRLVRSLSHPVPRKPAVSLLALACALAFSHGWRTGADCDSSHCPSISGGIQLKEEQR